MKKMLIILVAVFFVACQAEVDNSLPPTGNVIDNNDNDESIEDLNVDAARSFMLSAPTYDYDGSGLVLVEDNGLDTFIFRYQSDNTGYGNRENLTTLDYNLEHETIVVVNDGVVTSAITDNYWDEINQEYANQGFIEMRYDLVQCETDTPWQLWHGYVNGFDGSSENVSQIAMIERYYDEAKRIDISDLRAVRRTELTCQACNECLAEVYYTVEVGSDFYAKQLEDDGWSYVSPMSLSQANFALEAWINNIPTYIDDGRNLEQVISYVDSESPQVIKATYSFETIDGGFGEMDVDRVIGVNYHIIEITLTNGIVTSAVINNKWDVLNQTMI